MASASRRLMIGTCCAGLLALVSSFPLPVFAQAPPPNAAEVSDLVCPNASPARPRPAPQPHVEHPAPMGSELPSNAELGALARTVIRPQPQLGADIAASFAPGTVAAPRRIALWGDSHLAGGPFAPTLIHTLSEQGLGAAVHFLPPTMGRANVVLPGLRAYCIGPSWTTTLAYTSPTALSIGPALADRVAEASPDSYLWLDLRNSARQTNVRQVQLLYRAPAGATLDYRIDDGSPATLPLPPTSTSQTVTFRADRPIATLRLRVAGGQLDVQGFLLDRTPGARITIDTFGIPSATVKGWANADPLAIAQALHGTHYDAVVLEYGTNEGADRGFTADKYASELTSALSNLRQVFPRAACVLVGPPDRGVLRGHGPRLPLLTYSHIHQRIAQIQREVGRRFACAAWNWQDLMGGPGGSYGWAHAQPSLMGRDLIHLSPAGYRLTGKALAHSLGWSP